MKLGQALKMAIRSIGAGKVRTALTMLGIIIMDNMAVVPESSCLWAASES